MAAYYIKRLIDNKEENMAIGIKAREIALNRHDKRQIVEELLEVYKQVKK